MNRKMKKMQKLVVLMALLLAAGLFLVACSNQGSGSVGPPSPVGPQGPVGPQSHEGTPSENLAVIENSGQLLNKEYIMDPFDEIEIQGLDVTIKQADSHQVTLNVEKNLNDFIIVEQLGNKVRIGLDPTKTYHMENITQIVEITTPNVRSLVVNGIGMGTLDGFVFTENLEIVVSDLGTLRSTLDAKDIKLLISSLNPVILSGSAGVVTVEVVGLCDIDLSDLYAANITVNAEGLCKVVQ